MAKLSDDDAEILALIHANRIAVWTQDFEMYQKCFVHEPYTTRWNASPVSGIMVRQGWANIAEKVKRMFAEGQHDPKAYLANAYETKVIELKIRISGEMAWATFRQEYPAATAPIGLSPTRAWHHAGPSPSHEMRVFEKQDGHWRIAFLGFLDPDSDRSNSTIVRLGQDGTVEWLSPSAAQVLATDDDLVVRNSRLRVRDSKTDARLQAAIAWAAALSAPIIPSRGSLPIVMHRGEGLPSKVWWIIAESGRILLLLDDPSRDGQRLEAAAIIYALSPAQTSVASHVVAGRGLPDIAEAMGISVNTARTHLDRIFVKTGVRNQAALVRVLLSAAPPI